jgi:hypothetical protein
LFEDQVYSGDANPSNDSNNQYIPEDNVVKGTDLREIPGKSENDGLFA